MTQWLDDDDACFVFYRETSGGRSIQHLEAGDLDMAMLGSTPYATARGAGVSAVSILHFKGAAQALVTRPDLTAPQDLAGTVLWTPYTSTTHYILLAGLAQAGFDVDEVALVTKSPAEIIAAWDAGDIDGAACWGNTMQHLLDNAWGGEGGGLGRAMIDAATVAQWGFETGNVLGASDAFLAAHGGDGGLVERVVGAFARANYDYAASVQSGSWASDGDLTELVDHFVYLSDSTGTEPHDWDEHHDDVYDRIHKFEYPTIAEQLDFDIAAMTRRQASFLYLQKALASDPASDSLDYYASTFDASILEDLARGSNEAVALDAAGVSSRGWPAAVDVANVPPPEQYPSSDDPGCAAFSSLRVSNGGSTFDDGSTATNAYAADATCVWAVTPESEMAECATVSLTRLASEAPHDVLEVFAANGDLLARYMGRHLEGSEHPAVTGCYDASVSDPRAVAAALVGDGFSGDYPDDAVALYVRWSTDGYDEHAVGRLDAVGFEASATAASAAPPACDPGYSGASCDHAYCMGVLDVDDGAGTLRSQPSTSDRYAPRSTCGWRVSSGAKSHVSLDFTFLGLERGFDFVRVYEGAGALPPGYGASSTIAAGDYVYSLTGDDLPDYPIIVEGDAFVVFESDGLTNAIVDGDALGVGGFEVPTSLGAATLAGLSLIFPKFDLEWGAASGSATSDHVAVYLVEDYDAPDVDEGLKVKEYTRADLEDGVFALSTQDDILVSEAQMAPYSDGDVLNVVVAFEADKNNPEPYSGFDAHFAGYWVDGEGNPETFCDAGASGFWDCDDGQTCGAESYCVASSGSSKKGGVPVGAIVGIVVGMTVVFGAGFFLHRPASRGRDDVREIWNTMKNRHRRAW
ncbi:platelet-activating factor acetyltransferase [Aureococcus anophagefferens]|nr:platelet-activating factor acetyltransferase [Aureococcus anophagefferens]